MAHHGTAYQGQDVALNGLQQESVFDLGGRLAKISEDILRLRERLRRLNSALTGSQIPDQTAGPKPVPSGIVGALTDSVSSISSNLSHVEDEMDRLERTLGVDQPPAGSPSFPR